MALQVIKDGYGNDTGIFVPINDWEHITQQYQGLKELVEVKAYETVFLPDWQVELGIEELQNIASGNTELMPWDEAKKQLKL